MEAKVFKVSKSGKTMLVGIKSNKHQIGYSFGWAANPDNLAKGDAVEDFKPKGTEPVFGENGEQLFYENGQPLLRWAF